MKKTFYQAFAVLGLSVPLVCVADNDETIKQVTRQVTRQISNSISNRISESKSDQGPTSAPQGEYNLWGSPQYTDIASTGRGASSTSVYSMTFGGDRKFGNTFLGASLSYNRGETLTPGSQFMGMNAWSVAPYLAYKFNDNVFFSGILGYAGSQIDNSTMNSQTFLSDISLNGLTNVSGFNLSGKFGYRGIYTDSSGAVTLSLDPNALALLPPSQQQQILASQSQINKAMLTQTAYVGGEVSRKIDDFRPYFASTWEHIVPDQSGQGIKDLNLVFSTLGLDYSLQKNATVGLYYTRELTRGDDSQNHTIYNAAGANVKVKF